MVETAKSQATFCEEFIMRPGDFDPRHFGLSMDRDEFQDRITDAFGASFKGQISLDELLLNPVTALQFCDDVRKNNGWYDLPDNIILRAIMSRRKRPDR